VLSAAPGDLSPSVPASQGTVTRYAGDYQKRRTQGQARLAGGDAQGLSIPPPTRSLAGIPKDRSPSSVRVGNHGSPQERLALRRCLRGRQSPLCGFLVPSVARPKVARWQERLLPTAPSA